MPREIRQKLRKSLSEMEYDELDKLFTVLIAIDHLAQKKKPQTIDAIFELLLRKISKSTIRKYRAWLYEESIISPPPGMEDTQRWNGRRVYFTVHRDRVPIELLNMRASNHVLRKKFDILDEKGVATYTQDGKLRINAHKLLELAKGYGDEDQFLESMIKPLRSQLPPQYQNVSLTRERFIEIVDGQVFDTDFEKHRYPLHNLLPKETQEKLMRSMEEPASAYPTGLLGWIKKVFKLW